MTDCQTAMYGDSFCSSGRNVIALLGRNGLDYVVLERVSRLVLFVARFLGIGVLSGITVGVYQVNDVAVSPLPLLFAAGAASLCFSVMSIVATAAINTVFVCYAEDVERNRHSGQLFASSELHNRMQLMKGRK